MKIAFLNIYNGVIDRGAETFVKELAKRLTKNHEVTVFQSGNPLGNEKYKVERISVNWDWSKKSGVGTFLGYIYLDYRSRQIFLFSLKAARFILKGKFDIVIPVNGGWMPAIMRLTTLLSGSKMIISGQSGIGWDDRNNLWCFPDYFVALSSQALKWAKKAMPLAKSVKIPNGTDTKRFSSKGNQIKTKLKRPIILCAAALIKSKRVDLVIKAVAKLKNASLLIAGNGSEKENLKKLAEKLMPDRFEIRSFKYEDMPSVYRLADLFTIVSESYYAFEIVLVEAMASGLAVVANDDQIRKEIVGDAGLLVNPLNIDQYANTLKKALNIKWGEKPKLQAKIFDWDKTALNYEKLFYKLEEK